MKQLYRAAVGYTALGLQSCRPLRYEEVSAAIVRQGMIGRAFPETFVDSLLDHRTNGVGQPAPVSNQVEKILGRASTFADWAADHAADFRS